MMTTALYTVHIWPHVHLKSQAVSELHYPCALPLIRPAHVSSVSLQNIDFLEHLRATRMLGLSLVLSYEQRLSLCWCGFIFPVLLLGLFL